MSRDVYCEESEGVGSRLVEVFVMSLVSVIGFIGEVTIVVGTICCTEIQVLLND